MSCPIRDPSPRNFSLMTLDKDDKENESLERGLNPIKTGCCHMLCVLSEDKKYTCPWKIAHAAVVDQFLIAALKWSKMRCSNILEALEDIFLVCFMFYACLINSFYFALSTQTTEFEKPFWVRKFVMEEWLTVSSS